jgi:hypothetical protein
MYETHVGIDWASAEHEVCVLAENGDRLARFAVAHSEDGLDGLVGRLGGFGDRARVGVAIERPDGLVVDRLLEAGHPVVAVKPAAVKAYRSAETPSGAKSGSTDVFVGVMWRKATWTRRPFPTFPAVQLDSRGRGRRACLDVTEEAVGSVPGDGDL